MATSQEILNDVDLRYRNTFTTSQKLVWLNEEKRELFDVLEIESEPYAFVTVEGESFYPFPQQFDYTKITVVNIQLNTSTGSDPVFQELPPKRNDDNVYADRVGFWFSIVNNNMYINYPGGVPDNLTVYIYVDSESVDVTNATLNVPPDLPTKYQEVLKLGILKRIAMARKDTLMYNNYTADYNEKITDVVWQKHVQQPEFIQPTTNQKIRSYWNNIYVTNGW